jgi:peptidoglycan hydrolase CwlO-like protein
MRRFWYNISMKWGAKKMDNDELFISLKNIFEKQTDEIKQYVDEKITGQGVIIEGLRSDIKAVAEGHSILNNKIDKMQVDLNETKQDVKSLQLDVKSLKTDMKVVKDYVIGVDERLNEHEIILKRVK